MNYNITKNSLNLAKKLVFYVLVLTLLGSIFPVSAVIAQSDPLVISNIQVQRFDESATITWNTNRAATGKVEYGSDPGNYRFSVNTNIKATSQAITIFGLQPESDYYFRVTAEDDFSIIQSFEQNFETSKDDDQKAPVIKNVRIPYVSGTTATIQWETDEPSDSAVDFGLTTSYGSSARSGSRVKIHDITLTRLKRGTTYQFQVKSTDKFGNTSKWFNLSFRTSNGISGEDIDLEIFGITPSSQNDPKIGETTAVITWRTNKLTEGSIRYSTSPSPGKTVNATVPRDFFHSVTLTDLNPGTTYYFDIYSKDVFGKQLRTGVLSFTTRSSDPVNTGSTSNTGTVQTGNNNGVVLGAATCNVDLTSDRGYFGQYFNFDTSHPDVRYDRNIGVADENDWYDAQYFSFERVDRAINFTPSFYDVDEGKPGDPNHFAVHWRGIVDIPSTDEYEFEVASDDDMWIFLDGEMLYDNHGLHRANSRRGNKRINGGLHVIDVYYADRRAASAVAVFKWLDSSIDTYPLPPGCSIDDVLFFNQGGGSANGSGVILGSSNDGGTGGDDGGVYYDTGNSGAGATVIPRPAYVCNPGLGYTKFKALYRTSDSPDIWALLETGQKHYITSPESFALYQCNWDDVQLVSRQFLNQFDNATLVRTPEDPVIYHLFDRPNRQWLKINIPSPTIFVSYPNNYWGNVARINHLDLASYPHATLIKQESQSTVYQINGTSKNPFVTPGIFTSLGYDFAEVVTLNDIHMDTYVTAEGIQ